jgi:hypothetical protein
MFNMIEINELKKEKIIEFLNKEPDKWFTLNQIAKNVKIHIYKAEVLLQKLFYERKVENKAMGNFNFWRIKK